MNTGSSEVRPQNAAAQPQVANRQVALYNAQAAAKAQQQAQAIAQQEAQQALAAQQKAQQQKAQQQAQQQAQKAQQQAQAAQVLAQQQKAQQQAQAQAQKAQQQAQAAQVLAQQQKAQQQAQAQAQKAQQAQVLAQQQKAQQQAQAQAQKAQQAQAQQSVQGRLVPYNSQAAVQTGQQVPRATIQQVNSVPYNSQAAAKRALQQPQVRIQQVQQTQRNTLQQAQAQQAQAAQVLAQQQTAQQSVQAQQQVQQVQQVQPQAQSRLNNNSKAPQVQQVQQVKPQAQSRLNNDSKAPQVQQVQQVQPKVQNRLVPYNSQAAARAQQKALQQVQQVQPQAQSQQVKGQNADQGNGQDRKSNSKSQSRIAPCDSQDIAKYERYLKLFCKYNDDTIYNSLAILAPTLWIWVILSCYDKVVYQPKLITSSCNASYTFLKCESAENAVTETLHAKVQMNPQSDSVIMDDINGYIMNMVVVDRPNLKPYFMEYVDSGVTFITKEDSKFDLKSIMMASEGPVTDDVLLSKMTKAVEKSLIRKVTFNKAVNSPTTLAQAILNQEKPLPIIMKEVSKLLAALQILGTKYGFAHNDAHLNNILFDGKTGNLVMIDFGRCIFDVSMLDTKSQQNISDRISFEESKSMDVDIMNQVCDGTIDLSGKKSYAEFIKRELAGTPCRTIDLMTPPSQEISSVLYMFDVMKISYQVLIVLAADPANELLVSPLMECNYLGSELIVKVPTINTLNSMVNNLLEEIKPMVPGIYWFSLMIEHIVKTVNDERLTKKLVQVSSGSQSYMFVDMEKMEKAGFLSKSGTVLELPFPSELQRFIMQNMNDIERYAFLLKNNVRNQAGAGKAGKAGKATKLQRSLKTHIEKGSSKLFQAENNAYGYRLSKMLKGGALTNNALRQILGEDVNDPLQCPIRSNTQKADINSFPDVDFTF